MAFRHLQRLDRVWMEPPIYFITTCTAGRTQILITEAAAAMLRREWHTARARHGWCIGRYVIMPDHVHFFAAPEPDAKTLSQFMQAWKQWTAKALLLARPELVAPIWQREFFDHLLRSDESYAEKWDYVRENPVRAGLVRRADEWAYAGEIEVLRR